MRISKIKLAGFKSFVDPTTLTLPGALTSVVGPNGCGKSNVIDAVNWVMGESSAKQLRGESMADVIFSGSNTRKPVGQAVVELVFDNSDGKIGGQYAGYIEISIKRQITRDGISAYFLNGTRCRRKDITALFLGTGVGVRSYAVIEQGTISRVIEAKPEELRVFLEEAAGISKYKERRRETENRIRHTRDNLARLNDIREELEKQLIHLERQSKAAERFQVLKDDERQLRAQLLAVRWRDMNASAEDQSRQLQEHETAVEAAIAEVRAVEARTVSQREQQVLATDGFNEVQSEFYRVGAEISRLEQAIQHTQQRREQLVEDLYQAKASLVDAEQHLETDDGESVRIADAVMAAEPGLDRAQASEREKYALLTRAEENMQAWQTQWDDFNLLSAESTQSEQVEQTKLEHLELGIEEANQRLNALQGERDSLDAGDLTGKVQQSQGQLLAIKQNHDQLVAELAADEERARRLRGEIEEQTGELDTTRDRWQGLKSRIASLTALQRASLGADQSALAGWIEQNGFTDAARLAQFLEVEDGWEAALETALPVPLNSMMIASLTDSLARTETLVAGTIGFLDKAHPGVASTPSRPGLPLLLDKVTAPWPLTHLLGGIYAVETLAQAEQLWPQLGANESVVTRDGVWLGEGWAQVHRPANETDSFLLRERELAKAEQQATQTLDEVQSQELKLQQSKEALNVLGEQTARRNQLGEAVEQLANYRSEVAANQARLEQVNARSTQIDAELSELEDQITQDLSISEAARSRLESVRGQSGEAERERTRLLELRDQILEGLQQSRERWREARDRVHEIRLQVETMRSQRTGLEHSRERYKTLAEQLRVRVQGLERAQVDNLAPVEQMKNELEEQLSGRLQFEVQLNQARQRLQDIDEQLRELEQTRTDKEGMLQQRREAVETARVESRGMQVRLQDLAEQLTSSGFELTSIVAELERDADAEQCQQQIEKVERRIARLGPINLAAIDEFTQLSERKAYLDSQYADLTEALDTLSEAIRKIDRDTRTRFKETYDKVNTGLQTLFPVLFGGGHAYLEMTGDNLLETGVTVMARPPGKRNSSIHLLSGGEKALTALALVFAIFELNPAPFCLLDEVDAPLDDNNVIRFCDLLRTMAGTVQFVCITHNKITMEISEQLIGVTMHEPGVSRLVSVDMEQAVEMAASA